MQSASELLGLGLYTPNHRHCHDILSHFPVYLEHLPHLFDVYTTRYGVIGAVFAMISSLFCIMCVLVGSAAAGREIHVELERLGRGEALPEDEVRKQWDEITREARSRWQKVRTRRRRG